MTRMNYHKSLDAAITCNAKTCDVAIWCNDACLDPVGQTIIDWLLDTSVWQLLQLGMFIWSTYTVFTGLVSFLIRVKNMCARRMGTYGCHGKLWLSAVDTSLVHQPRAHHEYSQLDPNRPETLTDLHQESSRSLPERGKNWEARYTVYAKQDE